MRRPQIQPGPLASTNNANTLSFAVTILIVSLIVPLTFHIGSLRLSAYRIVLIFLMLPAIYRLLSGRLGKIRMPDITVALMCIWSAVSFSVIYGVSGSVEKIGIMFIETFGAYTIGRAYIRTPSDFYHMVKLFFMITLAIIPFALYETLTSVNITLDIFGKVGNTYFDVSKEPRWGLDRVQGPFEHPILFGVFFGAILGLVFFVLGHGYSFVKKSALGAVVLMVAVLSLSSGPLTSQTGQIFFISWHTILNRVKSKWYILAVLSVVAYIVIDILSNRTPFAVFISYFAFNASTAYNRILIWQYGTASIWNHPIFGIGLEEWDRAWFMSTSADMFWIVPAMRHGVPVWILHLTTFIWAFLAVAFKTGLSEKVKQYRLGYLCSMFGLFIAGWAVHYWNATFVLFMFLLSSGLWILDADKRTEDQEEGDAPDPSKRILPTYTRFP